MGEVHKFDYEGYPISFDFGDGEKMINATEMAKPFGRSINQFFRLKQTAEYIDVLYKSLKISRDDDSRLGQMGSVNTENLARHYPKIIRAVRGGNLPQGTWVHEKVALKFAAWLSPVFELWIYDRIHELLTTGKTELPHAGTGGIIRGLRLIVDQLENQEKWNEQFRVELDEVSDRLDELEAKVSTIDENYYSISGYCALNAIDCPLGKAKKWGLAATKLSAIQGIATGKAYDAKYGEINTYHMDILKQIIK
ncbi:MAG TPA: KilA-N domain-containing protein [Bacteroidetes bacterium]|nr:KilA-N domain-containing protein [Bacteroidota bacterium]